MFIFKNLDIEAKRRKLTLTCESSEAKGTWLFPKIKLAKRSELVYFKNWQYRSEANRFDSDFVFKKTKKSELSFLKKTKGKKRKGSIVNYRSFAIPTTSNNLCFCKFFAKGLKSEGERLKVKFWSSEMVKIGRGVSTTIAAVAVANAFRVL